MIDDRFGESSAWSLGVEEELMILDAETLMPSPAVTTITREAATLELPGQLATELHASAVELKTGVCTTAQDALVSLRELRRAVGDIAERHGLRLAAAGSHPVADPEELEIADKPRYHDLVEYAGVSARRQGVSGLHVHVGMPSAETCMHVLETVLPWLPVVLALSANSPYLAGRETGLASNRAEVLAQLPRSGAPPRFESYAAWEAFVERFRASGVPMAADYTTFWWDVRPHPRFGTLEIRMPDQPTALGLSGAFVALLQALCSTAVSWPYAAADRGVYQQNRWAAARFGVAARLIAPSGPHAATVPALARELGQLIAPAAGELGALDLIAGLDGKSSEADRQLEIGRRHGLRAVCEDLVERSLISG